MRLLGWPAKSPDFNPMENVWAYHAHRVYAHGRSYDTKEELRAAIFSEWDKIPTDLLQKLIASMPNRMGQALLRHGGYTGY